MRVNKSWWCSSQLVNHQFGCLLLLAAMHGALEVKTCTVHAWNRREQTIVACLSVSLSPSTMYVCITWRWRGLRRGWLSLQRRKINCVIVKYLSFTRHIERRTTTTPPTYSCTYVRTYPVRGLFALEVTIFLFWSILCSYVSQSVQVPTYFQKLSTKYTLDQSIPFCKI